jgi:hypothetical protein
VTLDDLKAAIAEVERQQPAAGSLPVRVAGGGWLTGGADPLSVELRGRPGSVFITIGGKWRKVEP